MVIIIRDAVSVLVVPFIVSLKRLSLRFLLHGSENCISVYKIINEEYGKNGKIIIIYDRVFSWTRNINDQMEQLFEFKYFNFRFVFLTRAEK